MWLNVKWYDAANNLLREDGKYGDLQVTVDGQPKTVKTTVRLTWPAAANASKYQVWRNASNSYFLPGASCTTGNGCSEVTGTSYDAAALGSTSSNTSYLVQPVAGCGAAQSTPSNRTGGI